MQINIPDAVNQTAYFIPVFIVVILLLLKRTTPFRFTNDNTTELKGLAILMVLFGHIGYFLSKDPRFLWPLSVDSGVGVNLFFFLSGFGLAASQSKNTKNILNFYKKRVISIYPSLWVVITIFFILDLIILGRAYTQTYIFRTFLGFFPSADLFKDINSPLWYITPIMVYYLVFPLLYIKRFPWLTAFLLFIFGYLVTHLNLPVNQDVLKLYRTHYLVFPTGVLFFSLKNSRLPRIALRYICVIVRYSLLILSIAAVGYLSIHSGVGEGIYKEQLTSLTVVLLIILISVLKGVSSKFLALTGSLSYELYLIHWPVLSRYDFLYKNLPAALATILYVVVLITLSWFLKKLSSLIH